MNTVKTTLLLGGLTGLLMLIGGYFGGQHGVVIAFIFALIMNFGSYWFSDKIILRMYHAREVSESQAPEIYTLVRNLTLKAGLPMPRVYIIPESSPNAFATGRNQNHAVVAVTEGILRILSKQELEGVIAHELTHIRNRDVRLLIVSVIFVGIFSFIANMVFRSIRFGSFGNRDKNNAPILLVAVVISGIAYIVSLFLRFGISRSREYMADAGAAEMTRRPYSLAGALRKIAGDPLIEAVKSRDVSQMFIENPQIEKKEFSIDRIFATHPPINKRIKLLEQFV